MKTEESRRRAKQWKKIHKYVRAAIQLVFFIFFPSAFTASFNGVKYIFTQIGTVAPIALTAFISILLLLVIYTIVFGRFFCGFACAFGAFGDALHALYVYICKKLKRKPVKIKESVLSKLTWIKYVILIVILAACFAGVYERAQGTSPWDVFSMVRAGNFRLGHYIPGVVILLLLIVGMCIQERFFCRTFCPMGAVFSILPVLPFFSLRRDRENCLKRCSACSKQCPSGLGLPDAASLETPGDCFQCQKCIDTCPRGNIHTGIRRLKGNELWFTILRAALLLALMLWLGI